jgi:hypothetical protein
MNITIDRSATTANGSDVDTLAAASFVRNGREGYALRRQARAGAELPGWSRNKTGFLALLGGEVRKEIANLSEMLRDFNDSSARRMTIQRQTARLDGLLAEMDDVAERHRCDGVFGDEPIAVASLVGAILPGLPCRQGEAAIRYTLNHHAEEMAPVYGNAKWLGRALHAVLAGLACDCPVPGKVAIELCQIGDSIVLTARVGADTSSLPSSPITVAELAGEQLSVDVSHRIVELHGGQIRLNFMSDGGDGGDGSGRLVESLTVTLPTGMPIQGSGCVSCGECEIALQAIQYAHDLAQLVAEGAPASDMREEIQS